MKAAFLFSTAVLALCSAALPMRTSAGEPIRAEVRNYTRSEVVHVSFADTGGREMAADVVGPGRSWSPCCFAPGHTYVLRIGVEHTNTNGTFVDRKPDRDFTVPHVNCQGGSLIVEVAIDSSNSVWTTPICRKMLDHNVLLPIPRPT